VEVNMHSKENVEFARENQSHYCGEKPLTVDEYIARQPEGVRQELLQVRGVLRATLPNAEERISWGMPTFRLKRNIIHFAPAKHHIGLYPGAQAVAHFEPELDDFKHSKGTIQLPNDKELPLALVGEITAWCVRQEEGA
jgi:uncharacterized protein YdhG (YjbR/CyaY superfamily)